MSAIDDIAAQIAAHERAIAELRDQRRRLILEVWLPNERQKDFAARIGVPVSQVHEAIHHEHRKLARAKARKLLEAKMPGQALLPEVLAREAGRLFHNASVTARLDGVSFAEAIKDER